MNFALQIYGWLKIVCLCMEKHEEIVTGIERKKKKFEFCFVYCCNIVTRMQNVIDDKFCMQILSKHLKSNVSTHITMATAMKF